MGIDYSAVGGIGFKLTQEHFSKMIEGGLFTEEQLEEDLFEDLLFDLCDEIPVDIETSGNSYTGNIVKWALIPGKTFEEILENEDAFLKWFQKYGIEISRKDLKVVSEGHVW